MRYQELIFVTIILNHRLDIQREMSSRQWTCEFKFQEDLALDTYLEVIRICVAFRAIRLGEDFFYFDRN